MIGVTYIEDSLPKAFTTRLHDVDSGDVRILLRSAGGSNGHTRDPSNSPPPPLATPFNLNLAKPPLAFPSFHRFLSIHFGGHRSVLGCSAGKKKGL